MKTDLSIKAAIYLRAAELVEQGHCKEKLAASKDGMTCWPSESDATNFCYYGARQRAAFEIAGQDEYNKEIISYTNAGGSLASLALWNDSPDTTAAMVAAKLREQAFA